MGIIVAGTGTAGPALNQLNVPWGVYVDESNGDTLYVADSNNNRVMKWLVNATNGIVVAGGNGAGALYSQLYSPTDVFVDSFETMYISDYYNSRIVKWLKNATNGTLVAGISGSAGTMSSQLYGPAGIQFDTNGYLYVTDSINNRVQRFMIDACSCLNGLNDAICQSCKYRTVITFSRRLYITLSVCVHLMRETVFIVMHSLYAKF
jgi:sugar lactone lactonase YvrE